MNRAIRPLGAAFDFYLPLPLPLPLYSASLSVYSTVHSVGRKICRGVGGILGPVVKRCPLEKGIRRVNILEKKKILRGFFFPSPFFENLRHLLIIILKDFVEILFYTRLSNLWYEPLLAMILGFSSFFLFFFVNSIEIRRA